VAAALAVSIQARKARDGQTHVTLTLVGSWDDGDAERALEEVATAWKELAESPTGRLLGLDQASHFESAAHPQRLTFQADLQVGPLARGLRDATSSDVREILELDPVPPTPPP
jgi:2'-5' RNA ligase